MGKTTYVHICRKSRKGTTTVFLFQELLDKNSGKYLWVIFMYNSMVFMSLCRFCFTQVVQNFMMVVTVTLQKTVEIGNKSFNYNLGIPGTILLYSNTYTYEIVFSTKGFYYISNTSLHLIPFSSGNIR